MTGLRPGGEIGHLSIDANSEVNPSDVSGIFTSECALLNLCMVSQSCWAKQGLLVSKNGVQTGASFRRTGAQHVNNTGVPQATVISVCCVLIKLVWPVHTQCLYFPALQQYQMGTSLVSPPPLLK